MKGLCSCYDICHIFVNRKNGEKTITESSRRTCGDVFGRVKNFYDKIDLRYRRTAASNLPFVIRNVKSFVLWQ